MSADDQIDVGSVGGDVEVARGHTRVVAHVGYGHNHVGPLHVLEIAGCRICGIDGVEITHTVVVALGDHSFWLQVYADESDALAAYVAQGVFLEQGFER